MVQLGKEGTLCAARRAAAFVRGDDVIHKLFTELAYRYKDRAGGYTRVLRTRIRVGDAAPMAYIELIDRENELWQSKPPAPQPAIRYWIVYLPVQTSASSLWSLLQESISKNSFDTPLYRFNIPNLRVGTLDSLLALNDDLIKVRISEYNNVRSQLNAINRKQTGSNTRGSCHFSTFDYSHCCCPQVFTIGLVVKL